jgi:ectoine hydroxylase-related dioxygenase (phytanoyl-CoA dioxygenase family)
MAQQFERSDPNASTGNLLAALDERGFLIFDRLIDEEFTAAIREALSPYLQKEYMGRNPFEGHDTERVYALLGKSPVFADLVSHPLVMRLALATLGENFQLTAALAINIHPGETPQGKHFDDAFYKIPRPRPMISLSTFWAIDPFTSKNGGTEIIPGSHKWGDDIDYASLMSEEGHRDLMPVEMPTGSLMIASGTLWHRGGGNHSDRPRLAITPQYCAAWARTQENMTLAVPPEMAKGYSEQVQALLGYSIHPPFMGHVDGRHPARHVGFTTQKASDLDL